MHTAKQLPKKLYVACSGGVDSVVLAHLAMWCKRDVTIAFFHHKNEFAEIEYDFVAALARQHKLNMIVEECGAMPPNMSKEAFWHNERHRWFQGLDAPVALGHHLDDAVEWYVMSALRGEGHYIPYANGNIIRPLLLQRKQHIVDHAISHKLSWLDDPSNYDTSFATRNRVRHVLMPECLLVNPGLHKVVRKRILQKLEVE